MVKKIIYLTYTRPDYTLNSVLIRGLQENGVEVAVSHIKDRGIAGFIKALSFYKKNSKDADVILIGYDSSVLVTFLRLFSRKIILYNAFLSAYERVIVSRELAPRFSIKAAYYWLIDFLAVHSADLTRLESNSQADYFKKLFKVSGEKLYRSWVGVDEDRFFYDPKIQKFNTFTVLFRGALMPEAGAEYIIKAAKILENENVKFIMIGGGMLQKKIEKLLNELRPSNLDYLTDFMPPDKLREMMQKCHLSLGQLSNHDRLTRTMPLKMFESLAMKIPYLTAANKGVLELLRAGDTCITCEPANAESLAEKVLWAKNSSAFTEKVADNGYLLYQEKLRTYTLAKNLLDKMKGLR